MRYSNARMALQILALGPGGPPMYHKPIQNIGINHRTKKVTTMDTSRINIGRHSFCNRLQCLRELNFEWKKEMSKDLIIINLIKYFFNFYQTKDNLKIIYCIVYLCVYSFIYLIIMVYNLRCLSQFCEEHHCSWKDCLLIIDGALHNTNTKLG